MPPMSPEEADAYRKPALDALGGDDPGAVAEAEPGRWRNLIDRAGAHLRTRPDSGDWSALDCLSHMADSELITSTRYRFVLAESNPVLASFDQDAWMALVGHSHDDPSVLLEYFTALRRANVALWRRTSIADRSRIGIHSERGPESYGLLFKLQAGHGRLHLAQAEAALAIARRPRIIG
jgi:hypothetical protein